MFIALLSMFSDLGGNVGAVPQAGDLDRPRRLALGIVFAVLVGGMLMPTLISLARVVLRTVRWIIDVCLDEAKALARSEFVRWIVAMFVATATGTTIAEWFQLLLFRVFI